MSISSNMSKTQSGELSRCSLSGEMGDNANGQIRYSKTRHMPNSYLLAILICTTGMILVAFNISYITEFQKALDEEVRGRVMSLTYMITTIVYISSAFFSGVLADMIDIKIVWGLFGGAHIIVTILILSVEKKLNIAKQTYEWRISSYEKVKISSICNFLYKFI